jgi:hypothetical protein
MAEDCRELGQEIPVIRNLGGECLRIENNAEVREITEE